MHSFDNTTNRVGFACKFSEIDKKNNVISIPEYNCKTTTIAWLNRQSKSVAETRLMDIIKHNVQSIKNVVNHLSTLDPELRMFRISSDVLPSYTHCDYQGFWRSQNTQDLLTKWFSVIGETARKNNVRLSFHPDQFCCIASESDSVISNSINELEYHADLARFMGYGKTFQDFKCNVHISGKKGPAGIREVYTKLSPEARNIITLENEEYTYGVDDTLSLSDIIPTVLDVHHFWIREGEYIQITDSRIEKIIESWRGIKPTMHYSVSREEYLHNHDVNILPDHKTLIESGLSKQKLRAHSDSVWNNAVNDYVLTFREKFNIMLEAKFKNLASFKLHEYYKGKSCSTN